MNEDNWICPICGGLHPAGHQDKELAEQLREARSQSRVNHQHRMIYQSQRDELGETLELIDTMVQRSVDYWRKSEEDHAEYYVDAYRCVQENIKSIKTKIQSSASKANKE